MNTNSALATYRGTNANTSVFESTPEKLIGLLFDRANEILIRLKSSIENDDVGSSGEQLSKAMEVVSALKGSLNKEKGGEVAKNLDNLYEHLIFSLSQIAVSKDVREVERVRSLLLEISTAWLKVEEAAQ
ncbi:MAG: flagellar export chaperone FliS [Pseudomonadota bacterium]|nr:flagellar export chaperone FliS [Pseudomonadota bacterium]